MVDQAKGRQAWQLADEDVFKLSDELVKDSRSLLLRQVRYRPVVVEVVKEEVMELKAHRLVERGSKSAAPTLAAKAKTIKP